VSLRVAVSPSIEPFADLWPTLSQPGHGAHYVFQTCDMIELWRGSIGVARKVQPLFVRIDDAGAPLALLALGFERRSGTRVLTFLDGGVADYNAPILFSSHCAHPATDIWRAVFAELPGFDAAVLDKMPSSVCGVRNPLASLPGSGSPPSGHEVILSGGWDEYAADRLHRPKDSRRKRRRLSEAGEIRFVIASDSEEAELIYTTLIRQKARRYLELNGADGFDRPGYRAYFRRVTDALFATGAVHLSALQVGDDLLATHWGLVSNGRFYCLMLAYADHPLARFSPARLLVEELVAWCFANRIQVFDLGYGDTAWKAQFAPHRLELFHAALPQTALGWTYLETRKLRDRIARPPSEQAA
jgi:CelD/BcsL family acetyltransferase involved in cellulose biosynthesis